MSEYITRKECSQINQQLMEDVKEIKQDVKGLNTNINDMKVYLAKLPDTLDERYASKRIERNMDKLTWFVVMAVVGSLLVLVIK